MNKYSLLPNDMLIWSSWSIGCLYEMCTVVDLQDIVLTFLGGQGRRGAYKSIFLLQVQQEYNSILEILEENGCPPKGLFKTNDDGGILRRNDGRHRPVAKTPTWQVGK